MAIKKFSRMTSKGQVTIPHNIRNKLDLLTGSKLEFVMRNNEVVMIPINNKLSNLHGILPKPKRTLPIDEMNSIIKKKYDRN